MRGGRGEAPGQIAAKYRPRRTDWGALLKPKVAESRDMQSLLLLPEASKAGARLLSQAADGCLLLHVDSFQDLLSACNKLKT